jgi:hypothetical protein
MSKKVNELLNRCAGYEALAILSDRKTFLKSLAQGFSSEEANQWENKDEFGNVKPAPGSIPPPEPSKTRDPISFDRISPTREPVAFKNDKNDKNDKWEEETIAKYENLDEFGNPKPQGIPAPSTTPEAPVAKK